MSSPQTAGPDQNAGGRTRLAVERTQLAWWRTGLTALAVGVGIGRVVPELGEGITGWPYVAIGFAFAVYGMALIAFGYAGAQDDGLVVEPRTHRRISLALALAGVLLGFATSLLILLA